MISYQLYEDRLSKPLPVVPSPKISQQIKAIEEYNQDNQEALTKWHHYLDGIEKYVSNRSIAWDYANRIRTFRNDTKFIGDFNYNVGYMVKWNSYEAYVYVFMINLNPQEFGLKIPPTLKENKSIYTNTTMNTQNKQTIRLTETQLRRMINETVQNFLKEDYFDVQSEWVYYTWNDLVQKFSDDELLSLFEKYMTVRQKEEFLTRLVKEGYLEDTRV